MTRVRDGAPPRINYSVPEVARSLGVSRAQAYRMAESGELPIVRIGRRVLVPVAAFERYRDEQATAARVAS